MSVLKSSDVRKILIDKCPPETEKERVYASILLALSDNIGRLDKQVAELVEAAKGLAQYLMSTPQEATAPAAESEGAGPSGPTDATPFPTGVKAQVPMTPATLDETVAAAQETPPTPDVGSSPAMNAAPIPKTATSKNGSKGAGL